MFGFIVYFFLFVIFSLSLADEKKLLILWCCHNGQGHFESSFGSLDECRPRRPATLRPSPSTWAVSPPVGCCRPHPPSPFIMITQPESRHSFYHPTDSGRLSRPKRCSKGAQPVPKAAYRSGSRDKHNRPRQDSNLSPLTPQST